MTSFLWGVAAGLIVGGFGGFVAARLFFTSKSDALANQRRDEARSPNLNWFAPRGS